MQWNSGQTIRNGGSICLPSLGKQKHTARQVLLTLFSTLNPQGQPDAPLCHLRNTNQIAIKCDKIGAAPR